MAARTRRWPLLLALLAGIAGLGALLDRQSAPRPSEPSGASPPAAASTARSAPAAAAPARAHGAPDAQAHREAVDRHFQRGLAMLHARRFDYAVLAFHEVLRLAPRLPEAHVNMGFSLLGQQRPAAARDFFATAIEIAPSQANAYYGLAVASEALADMPSALGAMRTFVHLSPPEDPFVRKARAALWEWQTKAPATPEPVAATSRAEGGR